jgi:hypothetical protein
MKASKTGLCVYRGVYWANQGLLNAIRALEQAEVEAGRDPATSLLPASLSLIAQLRRTQIMIEETREVMNRVLAEWIEQTK